MPIMNIYVKDVEFVPGIQNIMDGIKDYSAQKLSSGETNLSSEEITIRVINVLSHGMIGDIEVEVIAHAMPERLKNQDAICLDIRKYIMDNIEVNDVRVWILLPELGHSW